MPSTEPFPVDGGCTCGHVRYRMQIAPLFVHCCHCSWCRRESGAAFAVNAMIESDQLHLLSGAAQAIDLPSPSGKGQRVMRCEQCQIALWSHYGGRAELSFVRVGTLDSPQHAPPDIHIYTASKQPWVELPPNIPAVAAFYRRSEYWPPASIARHRRLFP